MSYAFLPPTTDRLTIVRRGRITWLNGACPATHCPDDPCLNPCICPPCHCSNCVKVGERARMQREGNPQPRQLTLLQQLEIEDKR